MQGDWDALAEYTGYTDPYAMLWDMYITQGLTVRQMTGRLGLSRTAIVNKIKELGIVIRHRGGAQAAPKKHYYLHLRDQRWIFSSSLSQIAKVMRMNGTYVMHYKNRVRGGYTRGLRANMPEPDAKPMLD